MHAINGVYLKARKPETAMKEGLKLAKRFAYLNVDRLENPSGTYHGDFRFYNYTFNNEEEAYNFFDSLGAYCDGVVMIRQKNRKPKYFAKFEVHC